MAEQQEETKAKNTVTVEEAGPCRKKVIVEIPRETLTKATDEQYETLRKDAVVPGFRKGRAPRRLLEKRFGKDTGETVKLKLLAEASDEAIKESKLDILREPNIDYEKITLPDEGPMKFDFEVEVRPEFELPSLEGIPVEKTKAEVTEGHIENEIEAIRKYAGVWTPKDGGKVEAGNQVVADVMLNIEGQEEKLDNTEITVKPNGFIGEVPVEKLDEILTGTKSGETKEAEVTVAKTYFKEELRGKKVEMRIEVKDIKWLKPADLNEDLIKKCGVASEEELRKMIKEQLQGRLENQAKSEMAEQIYKYLLEKTDFELPMDVAADQAVSLLRRQYVNMMMQGIPREKIDEHIEQLKASSEQQAQQQLKVFFLMDKVAKKLGIEVTEEEINGHIAQAAIQRKVRPERLKEEMERDGSLGQFKQQVREQKCIAKMLETAKITEVKARHTKAEHLKAPASPKSSAATGKKAAEKPAKKAASKTKKSASKGTAEKKTAKKTKAAPRKKKT